MIRIRSNRAMCAWLLLADAVAARAEERDIELEYKVKAAFLANFTQFVEWPKEALGAAAAPIVIAVLGSDPFGQNLERAAAGKNVNGRKIVVRRCSDLEDAAGAHVLYIGSSERDKLPKILEKIKRQPVLTVSESPDFIRLGGIIKFTIRDERVHLDINPDAAQEVGLAISSKLLRLSNIVKLRGDAP